MTKRRGGIEMQRRTMAGLGIPAALALLLVMGVVLVAGVWLSQQQGDPYASLSPELRAMLWPEPRPVAPFQLVDHHAEPFTEERLKGQWTFLFFGYAGCPDVCPMALRDMSDVRKVLARDGLDDEAQFVFMTVDPERDTVELLSGYVPFFDEEMIGVTGPREEVDALTRQMAVMAVRVDDDESDFYHFDHTSSVLLIDPRGRVVGAFSPPHIPERMAEHFTALRNLRAFSK